MNSSMVKPETIDHLHLVYHLTVPLNKGSSEIPQVFLFVSFYREGRRIGIAANSSVQTVTKLQTFVIKNLKNSRCANLLPNRKSHLLFILSQSKADI